MVSCPTCRGVNYSDGTGSVGCHLLADGPQKEALEPAPTPVPDDDQDLPLVSFRGGLRFVDKDVCRVTLYRLAVRCEAGLQLVRAVNSLVDAFRCRFSQELDLAGKVLEKVTSGVKQTLSTQV